MSRRASIAGLLIAVLLLAGGIGFALSGGFTPTEFPDGATVLERRHTEAITEVELVASRDAFDLWADAQGLRPMAVTRHALVAEAAEYGLNYERRERGLFVNAFLDGEEVHAMVWRSREPATTEELVAELSAWYPSAREADDDPTERDLRARVLRRRALRLR